jgi:U2-associated protein SR140
MLGAHAPAARRQKAGLSGFVAYMKRKDAERAVKELDGFDWGGFVLRVGWSKMIRLPARPLYRKSSQPRFCAYVQSFHLS